MKSILLLFTFIITTFASHSQNIEGTYSNKWTSNTGEGIEYVLTLNEEGSFTFNYILMYKDINSNSEIEVIGTWNIENHLLVLNTTNANGDDNKIANGLNLNKARVVSISPRHPNFNSSKSSLKFYKSDVFYAKDMELIKLAPTLSSLE